MILVALFYTESISSVVVIVAVVVVAVAVLIVVVVVVVVIFFIYLFVGSFYDPEWGGKLSFWKLNAIKSRHFITRSCWILDKGILISCWVFGKGF